MVSLLPEGKSGIQLSWHSRIRQELVDTKSTELIPDKDSFRYSDPHSDMVIDPLDPECQVEKKVALVSNPLFNEEELPTIPVTYCCRSPHEDISSFCSLSSDLVASPTVTESRKIRAPTINSPGPPSQTDRESSEVESATNSFLVSRPSTTPLSDEKIIRLSTTDERGTKESTHLSHEEVSLLVSFVGCQSPSELLFRTTEMMQEFLKVHNALYTHFEVNGEASVTEEPIYFDVGFLCAVNHEGRWYRAQVVDMEQYPNVTVFLLDRGVTCNVAASEIRRIPGGLTRIPRTLIHCSLHGICPPSGNIWEEEVTQL